MIKHAFNDVLTGHPALIQRWIQPARSLALVAMLTAATATGCGNEPEARTAAATASSTAPSQTSVRIGDVVVYASAQPTAALNAAVAKEYGVPADDNTAMLLVAPRTGTADAEHSVPVKVTATATDLRGRMQSVELHEVHSGDLLDYVGSVDISAPETLQFKLEITGPGGGKANIQFQQEFYPR